MTLQGETICRLCFHSSTVHSDTRHENLAMCKYCLEDFCSEECLDDYCPKDALE